MNYSTNPALTINRNTLVAQRLNTNFIISECATFNTADESTNLMVVDKDLGVMNSTRVFIGGTYLNLKGSIVSVATDNQSDIA